jgi:hypothetical protein
MEFTLELIPPRLFAFIIAVLFIAGGVYAWQQGSAERALFDTAVGPRPFSAIHSWDLRPLHN